MSRTPGEGSDPDPDYVDLVLANKRGRRGLSETPRVISAAIALAWTSGRTLWAVLVALSVGSALLTLAQLVVIRELVTQLLTVTGPGGQGGAGLGARTVFALLAFVAVTGAAQAMSGISRLLQRLLAQLVLRRATDEMLEVTSSVDVEAYEDGAFFGHLKRVETNGLTKPMEVVQALVQLFSGALASVLLIAYVASVEPLLVPLLAVTAIPAYLIDRRIGRQEFSFAVSQVTLLRRRDYLANVLKSRLTARELRSFEAAPFFRGAWHERAETYLHNLWMLTHRQIRMTIVSTLVSALLLAGVGLFVVWRVQTGAIPLAAASAAIVGLRFLATRAQETGKGIAGLLESRLYLRDLAEFRGRYGGRTEQGPPSAGDDGTAPLGVPAEITVDGVGFTYPGATRRAVSDVNFTIRRGEVVALVGQNGSGKTTVSMMLAGLLSPGQGHIRWDGVPLTGPRRTAARRHVCVVLQDFVRYEMPAYDNVVLGHPRGDERLDTALAESGADYLRALPDGLETMLSKEYRGGQDLSAGQWQRVALARAFHRDSPIIVLDEPASALDAKAEHDLFEHLRALWANRTVVIVSHRLASVRDADRIVVLDRGQVDDQGTHAELMERGGLYAEMFELQARDYRDYRDVTATP
jgi:ATP-binding cassette subfamily B protein